MSVVAQHALALVVSAADKKPDDNDVVAGGWGALVFVLLILAVAVLGWSLTKHLRKAQEAQDAGVYGDDPPPTRRATDQTVEPSDSEPK